MSQDSTSKPTLRTIEDSDVPSPPPTPTPGTPCSRTPAGQRWQQAQSRRPRKSQSQDSPRSETSSESIHRLNRIVDTDPRTVRFTFGQRKARVKEFADHILDEHGEKVFLAYQNPETRDTFGYWKIFALSEEVLDLAENWLREQERQCVSLIMNGEFKRHRSRLPDRRGDDRNNSRRQDDNRQDTRRRSYNERHSDSNRRPYNRRPYRRPYRRPSPEVSTPTSY